jgi:hypothetical protein
MDAVKQKQAARKFVEHWTFRRGSEKGEDQQFWNSLLRDVLGVADVEGCIRYQVPVPMAGTTKFLDAWIPETRVLVEHKSRGIDLDAPQSGHDGLTPYEQAAEYDNARPFDERARWIVTCNFDEFRIYDRAKPLAPPLTLKLRNLPKEAYRLAFLVNPKEKAIDRELEISVQAGRIVGEIYDALLKQYEEKHTDLLTPNGVRDSGNVSRVSGEQIRVSTPSDHLAALNRLCVRLVFCLYAEDADIFPKDSLRRLVEAAPLQYLRGQLLRLFQTLDTPIGKRDPYLEHELAIFPYTNGGLFRIDNGKWKMENAHEPQGDGAILHSPFSILHSNDDIPPLTEEIRKLLVGASQFDWREITPTIFGALFESTLNPVTRRAGGMVYTSVGNIHKVIDPLFLSDLTRRVNECIAAAPSPRRTRQLLALQDEMASLTFLDPACGSGNFLTETYICLRRLENRIIAALQQGQGELDLGVSVKVSIAQFHGIEINDFAVSVAKTALWIAEAQMLRETAEILHREPDFLPLKDYDGIVEGNALTMDWPRTTYIMGNPPFLGKKEQSPEQKAELRALFPNPREVGNLDYVSGWYRKASEFIRGTSTRCAFVSTNSITQGEQVAALWKNLEIEIDFAWRTFRWDNEAAEKAHVHCVIIGFHSTGGTGVSPVQNGRDGRSPGKLIFDGDRAMVAEHISPYLVDAPDKLVTTRAYAVSMLPQMNYGSMPIDDGHLILTPDERNSLLDEYPVAEPFVWEYSGGDEFLNARARYCLWLLGADAAVWLKIPPIVERVRQVRDFRAASGRPATRKLAATPSLFGEIRQPATPYLLIPKVSSETRDYVPIGFMPPSVIASGSALIVPDATPYHFALLTSRAHNAWMRAVAGRMKSDYQYSKNIVYNNFVAPEPDDQLRARIAAAGETLIAAREPFLKTRTLAQLYNPLAMPSELIKAHHAIDDLVEEAYGLKRKSSESEIVAHLFKLYAEKRP